MKNFALPALAGQLLLVLCPVFLEARPFPGDTLTEFRPWLHKTETEFEQIQREHAEKAEPLLLRLQEVNRDLRDPRSRTADVGFPLLWEKNELQETLQAMDGEIDLKLTRLRYRKSIEMLKMLYEKILSMEHHFSSLKTHQQVLRSSNPHEYPEFREIRVVLEERMKKKSGLAMPPLLQANPYMSAIFSVVGLTLGNGETSIRKEQMDKMMCIMDFTVQMHNDLSVIYYETEYLRDANATLKKDCETLFADCARQVGYTIPLVSCRNSDDWERLYALLDNLINKSLGTATPPASPDQVLQQKAEINLLFAVDRIIRFSDKYSMFVNQGNDYYKKFSNIVSGYTNAESCSDALPEQFRQLQTDIELTLEKFNTAYALPEIQGSRLKDLLYGNTE